MIGETPCDNPCLEALASPSGLWHFAGPILRKNSPFSPAIPGTDVAGVG
jgi:hypothetical protein